MKYIETPENPLRQLESQWFSERECSLQSGAERPLMTKRSTQLKPSHVRNPFGILSSDADEALIEQASRQFVIRMRTNWQSAL